MAGGRRGPRGVGSRSEALTWASALVPGLQCRNGHCETVVAECETSSHRPSRFSKTWVSNTRPAPVLPSFSLTEASTMPSKGPHFP